MPVEIIVRISISIIVGLIVGFVLRNELLKRQANRAGNQARKIVADAKRKQQDLLMEAKEKSIAIIDKATEEEKERRAELKKFQDRLEQRENTFDQKILDLEGRHEKLEEEKERLRGVKARLEELQDEHLKKLESISGLSQEQALDQLMSDLEKHSQEQLMSRVQKLNQQVEEELDRKAKKMLALVVERYAGNIAVETLSLIHI